LKLETFQIKNFRNLKDLEYKCFPQLNIFTGENAQGKTNILEALYVLATGTSFRTNINSNLINYDANGYKIIAQYGHHNRQFCSTLINEQNNKKNFTINKKNTNHNNADRLRVVLFTPDDLYLVKGSPSIRRNFIDLLLKQVSLKYQCELDKFLNVLKKRNLFLKKEQAYTTSFKIIDDIFIDNSAQVILARLNFINIINNIASKILSEINQENGDLDIRYALSFPINSGKINLEFLKFQIKKEIEIIKDKEIVRKTSLLGPHRDDINIYFNGKNSKFFASQGQQRNIAITLKLTAIHAFKQIKNYYPVLLMDEVLAEMDEHKRKMLLNYLSKANFQTFLTSVNLQFNKDFSAIISTVKNGGLT